MLSPDFERWWDGFRSTIEWRSTDAHESARRLRLHLRTLGQQERRPFLRQLLEALVARQHAYGVALLSLDETADVTLLRDLAGHLRPLPELQSDDEESHLADLMRILAASGDAAVLDTVKTYLLERPIHPHWVSVPWALWPHRKALFARAWRRYFAEQDLGAPHVVCALSAFVGEPGAVRELRRALQPRSAARWAALREALLLQASRAAWLTERQRAALGRAMR